jgi:hypothetical protein
LNHEKAESKPKFCRWRAKAAIANSQSAIHQNGQIEIVFSIPRDAAMVV